MQQPAVCKSINALKPPTRAGSHQKSRWCKASNPGITTGRNASLTPLSLCAVGAPPACASPTCTLRYPLLPSASRPPPVQLPSHRKHPNHCWLHCLGVRDMPQPNTSLFFITDLPTQCPTTSWGGWASAPWGASRRQLLTSGRLRSVQQHC